MEELREEIAKRLFMDDVRAEDGDFSWRNASVAVRDGYRMRAVPFLNLFEQERCVILAEDQSSPELPEYIKGWSEMLHEIYTKAGFRKVDI